MRVAFIGLGTMGFPMAGHLVRAGHEVTVFNRTPDRAERWVAAHGGSATATPAEAAQGAAIVFTCVGDDPDVREVVTGPRGAFDGMDAGAVLVDHTTTSAALARELADRAAARGLHFLDAPVSGGQSGAEQGRLTVMVGGDAEAYARAEPVIAAYARMVRLLGPSGSGQLAKMVNQVLVAGVLEGLAEGLYFAERAGLDVPVVVDVISRGAAQSWQLENRWATMLEGRYDFGFAVDWMRKDLRILLEEARRLGVDLPFTEQVDRHYADVQALGGGRWDTSSLIERLRRSG